MTKNKKESTVLVADFETTVYPGQTYTEVWAAALVPLFTEDVSIDHSIGEHFTRVRSYKGKVIMYYHNLKFDGTFWLPFLMYNLGFKKAFVEDERKSEDDPVTGHWLDNKDMPENSFRVSVSDRGQWYGITIRCDKRFIEIRDSLKLLPFSVEKIGKSFGTKHKKLHMEYTGFRYAGCPITAEEQEYIANDVLVVKEALEIMFEQGHTKLTIGACCLSEFKRGFEQHEYNLNFPNLFEDNTVSFFEAGHDYGAKTPGEYIRRSYRGGWCYLVKGKESRIYNNGTTADVNSLYPSMMSSESGNYYPVGIPHFWYGDFIPHAAYADNNYYFVRVRTRFYLKPGKLPFIQIKNDWRYRGTECLERSDVWAKNAKGEWGWRTSTYDVDTQKLQDTRLTMTMTMTDWELLKEHYDLVDCEILDGCWFHSEIGLFDPYMKKYKEIKQTSKGAVRELAKLFLNNLYGKMASTTDSSFKLPIDTENRALKWIGIVEDKKKPGYIPIGSAITSYARNFTIRAAQKNYHGVDKPGFIYADTDSIHCDLPPSEIVGIRSHPTDFCAWKLEACWDEAIFVRQKTYIERVTHEDLAPIDQPYYNVKCAGMPTLCKDLFLESMARPKKISNLSKEELAQYEQQEEQKYPPDHLAFIRVARTLTDFTYGLTVPGKLMPVQLPGGTVLMETAYKMTKNYL